MSEFTDSFHQLTLSIISQLTAFLQLRYRAVDAAQIQSPFATHPTTMFVAVSSFMFYYLFHVALLRSPAGRFTAFAQCFLVWSGYATVCTLVAVVFPDPASPFPYIIFGLLLVGEWLCMIVHKLMIHEEGMDVIEASRIKIYGRRVGAFLKNICCGRVLKFFQKQPEPILPT